jgi:tol-pal system protein YbgF
MKARILPAALVAAHLFTVSLAVVSSGELAAQGAVLESRPANPGQTLGVAQSGANSDALSLLLEQNQQLRTEVQALRALVEEQGFEIRKLQRDSLNRYTNIDQRLIDLENAAPSNAGTSVATAQPNAADGTASGNQAGSTPGNASSARGIASGGSASLSPRNPSADTAAGGSRRPGRSGLQPVVLSEQQLYQMAYDSVINSDFELSIAEFDQYLSAYPDGRFVTNAHYWKGQAYLYLNRFAEARDSYEIILEQFPDSAKLPDAMYGLGLAYQGLGNIPQARQLLNDIKRRFPNTGVANLADTRLLTLD